MAKVDTLQEWRSGESRRNRTRELVPVEIQATQVREHGQRRRNGALDTVRVEIKLPQSEELPYLRRQRASESFVCELQSYDLALRAFHPYPGAPASSAIAGGIPALQYAQRIDERTFDRHQSLEVRFGDDNAIRWRQIFCV